MGVRSLLTRTSDSSVLHKQLFLKECCCASHLQTLREQLPATIGNGLHWLKVFLKPHKFCSTRKKKTKRKKEKKTKPKNTTNNKKTQENLIVFILHLCWDVRIFCFLFQTILLFRQRITDLTNSINGCSLNSWFNFRSKEDHSHVKHDSSLAK